MNNKVDYIIHFIIGGILTCALYYAGKYDSIKICSIIPALPILGLYGLITIKNKNNTNINKYLINIVKFILISIILYSLIYLFHNLTSNIYLCIIIPLIIWLLLICYLY